MARRTWMDAAVVVGLLAVTGVASAQEAATRPPLLFTEAWKQPPYTGAQTDENRRVTPAAVTSATLELKLYGPEVRNVEVYNHEGRFDLWTGMAASPVAILIRDKTNNFDLSGLARLRAIVRTGNLHVIHPVLKLADGTLVAGSQSIDTGGEFLSEEVAFNNQRWYKLDPQTLVAMAEVKAPDLSKIEEVGFVDLAPSGGHGSAGYANISTIELYAKTAPRTAGTR
jgi:hypothetical protein